MFRALTIALFIAALTAQSGFASHRGDFGPAQLSAASRASLCDRLDARLGPKHVPYQRWSGC